MLRNSTPRKIVVSTGAYLRPKSGPRISSATFLRTKPRIISRAFWNRPGTTRARAAPMTKTSTRAQAMMSLTIMTRLSSKGVPWRAKGAGKKSSILGGSKPLSPEDAGRAPTILVARIALVITSPPPPMTDVPSRRGTAPYDSLIQNRGPSTREPDSRAGRPGPWHPSRRESRDARPICVVVAPFAAARLNRQGPARGERDDLRARDRQEDHRQGHEEPDRTHR